MTKEFKQLLLKKKPKKHCAYCRTTENLTYDHKIPIVQGGKDTLKNMQVLCKMCNVIKGGRSHAEVSAFIGWIRYIDIQRASVGKSLLRGKAPKLSTPTCGKEDINT